MSVRVPRIIFRNHSEGLVEGTLTGGPVSNRPSTNPSEGSNSGLSSRRGCLTRVSFRGTNGQFWYHFGTRGRGCLKRPGRPTNPRILKAFCIISGPRSEGAVERCLEGPIPLKGLFEEVWRAKSHRKGLLKDAWKAPYPRKGCLKKPGRHKAIGRGCGKPSSDTPNG